MKNSAFRGFAVACLATTAIVGVVEPAFAQIEEIVVTTRKRAENLQEIPIVVTAFTAENIERKGIAGINDILKYTPGVQIIEGFAPQDQRVIIRGLSPTRGRSNVAVLQDDIDISSESVNSAGGSLLINPRLFDLERVEIVKGPHSALYGRSAFAGAINYITKKPGDEFEGRVSADVGTYGKYEAKGAVSGPIVPGVLNVGVNASYWNFDGFYKNSLTNKKVGGTEGAGVAGTLLWKGSDWLKATLRAEYTDDDSTQSPRAIYRTNTLAPVPVNARTDIPVAAGGTAGRGFVVSSGLLTFPIVTGAIPDAKGLVIALSPNPETNTDYPGSGREIFRATLRLDAEFSMVDVSTFSHYGEADTFQFSEAQNTGRSLNTATGAAETNFVTNTKLHTQEIRVQSNDADSPLKWSLGGLYWNEEVNQDNRSTTCFTSFPALGSPFVTVFGNPADNCGKYFAAYGTTIPYSGELWGRNTFHSSLYGLVDFDITEQISISTEVRRTWEREHTKGPSLAIFGIDPYGLLGQAPNIVNPATGLPAGCAPVAPATISNCVRQQAGPTIGEFYKSSFWTPRVGLNFKINDEVLTYVSASRGVKPGGVSTVGGGSAPLVRANLEYEAEKMWVYEAGFKSTFADGKALFNAALYYQDYSDKQAGTQVLQPNGTLSTRIVNAASARTWGVDLEGAFSPTEALTFSAGYTWLDAKYKDFVVRTGGATPIVRSNNCAQVVTYRLVDGSTTVVVNPTGLPAAGAVVTARTCDVDKSGNKLEYAPTHSLQFNTLYKQDIGGDMNWVSELSIQATSKRWTDDDQASYLQGYITADIRSGIETDMWSVTGYVNNVFNDDTVKSGLANTDFSSIAFRLAPQPATLILANQFIPILPEKRQFGVRASYKF